MSMNVQELASAIADLCAIVWPCAQVTRASLLAAACAERICAAMDLRARMHALWNAPADRQQVHDELRSADGLKWWPTYERMLEQLAGKQQMSAPASAQAISPATATSDSPSPASALQTAAWEQLHSGHWASAPKVWRQLYERAGLAEVLLQLHSCDAADSAASIPLPPSAASAALRTLDLCLLMGAQDAAVTRAIHALVPQLEAMQKSDSQGHAPFATQRSAADEMIFSRKRPLSDAVADVDQQTASKPRLTSAIDGSAADLEPAACSSAASSSTPSEFMSEPQLKLQTPPVLPSSPFARPLPRLHLPSLQTFQRLCLDAHTPTILTGVMDSWPCFAAPASAGEPDRRWSNLEYLRSMCGQRTVPVEIGAHYLEADWEQKLMTVGEFIQQHIQAREAVTSSESSSSKAQTITSAVLVGYLAQHRLFDQIPALRNDLLVPDYCCLLPSADSSASSSAPEPSPPSLLAWFGPAETVSPLHFDRSHNLLAQVVGSKYIRLYSSDHSANLFPNEAEGMFNTSAIVDIEHIDAEKFSRAKELPYWEGILEAGSMLYIPPGCWHYVRSLSVSMSVSFWWE